MAEIPELDPLLPALRDLLAWWEATATRGIVIGAAAASILGRPRTTTDVDGLVLVESERWPEFLAEAARFGLIPRISDSLQFAQRHHVLLLLHEPSGLQVDVTFGFLPFEKEAITKALEVEMKGLRIPLPRPEDLVIMKAVARRPRDVADIEGVLSVQSSLDLGHVRRWLKEFAAALEEPDILSDFERIVAHCQRR